MTQITGAFAGRIPPRRPTLAELMHDAADAADALNRHVRDDDEWDRLNSEAVDKQQALRAALAASGLAGPLSRAIETGVV